MMAPEFDLCACGDLWGRVVPRGHRLLALLPAGRFLSLSCEDEVNRRHENLRQLIEFIHPTLTGDAWLQEAGWIPRPITSGLGSLDSQARRRLTRACVTRWEALG